jgi:hypothetical protein
LIRPQEKSRTKILVLQLLLGLEDHNPSDTADTNSRVTGFNQRRTELPFQTVGNIQGV